MRWIIGQFFVFFGITAATTPQQKICLNMIVKNEREVICRCLESAKPLIDYWVIIDTGSEDGTPDVIRECMKDIPGELHERPWVDFAYNRNEALDLAKDKADYLLFIDADDYFEQVPHSVMPFLDKEGYYFTIRYGEFIYPRIQLIRASSSWRWEGVVHEVLVPPNVNALGILEGIEIIVGSGGARSRDIGRVFKDAELLEAALRENPSNSRNVFYLAQTYKDAGMWKEALEQYERRISMGKEGEEVFFSLYLSGIAKEILDFPANEIISAYCAAHEYQPFRAEPLYHLAIYYRKRKNYFMGYLITQFALNLPALPSYTARETSVYEYGLLLEFAVCAYCSGAYEEAVRAAQILFEKPNVPENVRIYAESLLKLSNKV